MRNSLLADVYYFLCSANSLEANGELKNVKLKMGNVKS